MATRVGGQPMNPRGPGNRPQKKAGKTAGQPTAAEQPAAAPVPINPGRVTPVAAQPPAVEQPQGGGDEYDAEYELAYQSLKWHTLVLAKVLNVDPSWFGDVLSDLSNELDGPPEAE